MARLLGDTREEGALPLRLHDADGFTVDEEEAIAGTGLQRRFADRDPRAGERVELAVVLDEPARGEKLRVDLLTGALLRVDVGTRCQTSPASSVGRR